MQPRVNIARANKHRKHKKHTQRIHRDTMFTNTSTTFLRVKKKKEKKKQTKDDATPVERFTRLVGSFHLGLFVSSLKKRSYL